MLLGKIPAKAYKSFGYSLLLLGVNIDVKTNGWIITLDSKVLKLDFFASCQA